MQDMEFRLRHRYLDLIYNPETLDRAQQARSRSSAPSAATSTTRATARSRRRRCTPSPAGRRPGRSSRTTTPWTSTCILRIALELHLKRLLVGGIEKVYEIGRVFRNEGISPRHNPEFTMMELYQAYGDYRTMMDLTEGLIVACVDALGGGHDSCPTASTTVDFTPPWQRAKYADLFREHVGVAMDDAAGVPQTPRERRASRRRTSDHDVLVHDLFEANVEPQLETSDRPVFVYDYPAALCPLTKRKRGNPAIAERFELYVHGMELANAYTELNDPVTQEADLPPAAGRAAGRGLDGEDGRRLRPGPAARHAAGRRPGRRHRPAGDAADQHADDPRRDPVPAAAAGTK